MSSAANQLSPEESGCQRGALSVLEEGPTSLKVIRRWQSGDSGLAEFVCGLAQKGMAEAVKFGAEAMAVRQRVHAQPGLGARGKALHQEGF